MGASVVTFDNGVARSETDAQARPFKTRTMSGVLSSLLLFAGSFFVGILLTPFLVDRLGLAAYGLVPLSFAIANFLALATQVISAVVNQKLVASERDPAQFNHYFSVFFYACAIIATIAFLTFYFAREPLVTSLHVPDALRPGAEKLLIASITSVALVLLSTPACAVIMAVRGIDLINLARFADLALRVIVIVGLFYIWAPSLETVAIGLACGSIIGTFAIIAAALVQRPSLRLVAPQGAWMTLQSLMGLGAGVILIQLGSLLFGNTELILSNFWFGAEIAGLYAVSIQWPVVLRNLGLSLAATFVATVMRGFHQDRGNVKRQILDGMYFLAAFMGLAGGFCAGAAGPLMFAWLGADYSGLSSVLAISCLSVVFGVTAAPLYGLCLASGRVVLPGMVICAAGLLYIVVFVVLERLVGVGPFGLAAISAIVYAGHLLIFSLPYAAKQIGAGLRDFSGPLISSISWTMGAAVLARLVTSMYASANFLDLLICGFLLSPAYVALVFLTMPSDQRAGFIERLQNLLQSVRLRK